MAQEGFEPSASLVLSESGLPVAYRAKSSGGWNRTSGLHVQSVASLPAATTPESLFREGGFEPPPPDSKSGSLPVSRFPRRKERELNPQGSSLARVRVGCRRQSACPSCTSICRWQSRITQLKIEHRREESNLHRRLNRAPPYRWATPVLSSTVGMAGFEPAISCSRSRRIEPGFPTSRIEVPSGSRTRTSAMARR